MLVNTAPGTLIQVFFVEDLARVDFTLGENMTLIMCIVSELCKNVDKPTKSDKQLLIR